ncbi:MAG: PH domain-containing protein [Bacillota bacterium]
MGNCQETEEVFGLTPMPWEVKFSFLGTIIPLVFISIVVVIATALSEPAELSEVAVIFGVILSIVAVLCGLTPTAYILGSEGVEIIRRFAPPVLLPYAWIGNVYLKQFSSQPRAFFWLLPTHGTWVYFGRIKVAGLGSIRVYATSWEKEMVVLETDRGPYYLSPAEPVRFYETLRSRLSPH